MIRRPPRSTRTTHSFPTRRSSDLLNASLAAEQKQAMISGGALLAALLLALVLGTQLLVSRPLRNLSATISDLIAGRQDVVIPSTGRRDEVGDIARSLDVFKQQIVRNQQLQEDRKSVV